MTPSSVTCPHCQTSFRITKAQLNAADGSVRCGSCLQVFNAMDQLERARAPEPPPPTTIQSDERAPSGSASEQEQHDQKTPVQPQPQPQPQTQTIEQDQGSDHGVKEKIAPTALEYDGYQQQAIETLIEELDQQESEQTVNAQQHLRKRARWIIAALVLGLVLIGQFAWFNRQMLSLNPALRGSYALVCQLLPCTLPPLVDIKAIRSLELVIRSHPDHQGVLQVDTVIINEASHSQPYPDLQLTFTDLNGNVVANRTFTPPEYLAGELAGSLIMPTAQPVHLGLEIVDPGEQAVNYQLRFSASKAAKMP